MQIRQRRHGNVKRWMWLTIGVLVFCLNVAMSSQEDFKSDNVAQMLDDDLQLGRFSVIHSKDMKSGNDGAPCRYNDQCSSGNCDKKRCKAPTCTDGYRNGNETDIDCGGEKCSKCPNGKTCKADSDCVSEVCKSKTCQVPNCSDGVKNQDETDIDCGGKACPKCANTKIYSLVSD
ncbi:unnamed protein product [Rotaria socialis]|nr:unnamed protein product [Rotaria socialis]CAF3300244.1 unnamed protein product [Rotaria socialis]CAF3397703.1 unnamed protein product [Rotaria socialis]